MVKNLPAITGDADLILGQEDPLEKYHCRPHASGIMD